MPLNMEKYLLIFNAGYTFTGEVKKLGIRLQLMSLTEVLQYQKEAQKGFLAKRSWKYGEKFEHDVRKLFEKFKARVVGITGKDLEKIQKAKLQVETPGTEFFILDPWGERNEAVEKYFPPPKLAAATIVKKVETVDESKPPEGLINIRTQDEEKK